MNDHPPRKRPAPQGKPVSLFVTCMVDALYPETGTAVVELLRHFGATVDFPMRQTCCGQPAYNAGYRREAADMARHFLTVFRDAEVIVTPSGSCAAMIRHEYPRLFAADPTLRAEAERLAGITWEFTEFLVDGLAVDWRGKLAAPQTAVYHHSCHGLRLLGLGQAAETLLHQVENLTLLPWSDGENCCGFGGLFSVKMADISGAMLQKKLTQIAASGADYVLTGDVSCLTQMNGGLEKAGRRPRVRHVADLLAEAARGAQQPSP